MPDVTETEQGKQGEQLKKKFGTAVEALSKEPVRLANVLSYMYGCGNALKSNRVGYELYMRGFVSFLEGSEKKIPGNKQIAGFMAYAQWKLGWIPHKDAVDPILQAWNECGKGVMNEAVAELVMAEEDPMRHPLYRWPSDPPMLALPAPKPKIRPDYIRAVYVNSDPSFYRRIPRNDDEHLQLASAYGRVLELKPPCA